MDNFVAIYKILKYIEENMDFEIFDEENFQAETFGLTQSRFYYILKSLVEDGYIEGVRCERLKGDIIVIAPIEPRLTLTGMEYLADNTMMKKAYKLLKGIKDIIPGA